MPNSSTERLLLCCTGSRFDGETRQQVLNLLKEKIDWEGFLTQARDHGIAASAYLHFKQLDKGIPSLEEIGPPSGDFSEDFPARTSRY